MIGITGSRVDTSNLATQDDIAGLASQADIDAAGYLVAADIANFVTEADVTALVRNGVYVDADLGVGATVDATGLNTIDVTLTQDATLTINNMVAGQYIGLHVRQDAAGGHTLVVAGVDWSPDDPSWYSDANARTVAALYSPDGTIIEGVHNAAAVPPAAAIVQSNPEAVSSINNNTFDFAQPTTVGNRLVAFIVMAGTNDLAAITRDPTWTELAVVRSASATNPILFIATKVAESTAETYTISATANGTIQGELYELSDAGTPDAEIATDVDGISSDTVAAVGPISAPTTDKPGVAIAACAFAAAHGSVTALTNGYTLRGENGRLATAVLVHDGSGPFLTEFTYSTASTPRLALINIPSAA